MRLPTIQQLKDSNFFATKDELANRFYKNKTFDCALPQAWLDTVSNDDLNQYDILRGGVVWLYDANTCGEPAPITYDAFKIVKAFYEKTANLYGLERLRELTF